MTDKAHPAQLRKMRFALMRAKAHLPAHLPPLFALTDPARTPDPLRFANALPGGSGLIYRHFGAPDKAEIATNLVQIAAKRRLKLLIGNDPHLAMKTGAHGVHWAERDIYRAKYWASRFMMMTCAAHSRHALTLAQKAGMDAAFLSAVFPSNSPSAGKALGAHRFATLATGANLPVYGLGGVNAENAAKIAKFGGIAAIDGAKLFMRVKSLEA